jgi:hypothetical protein
VTMLEHGGEGGGIVRSLERGKWAHKKRGHRWRPTPFKQSRRRGVTGRGPTHCVPGGGERGGRGPVRRAQATGGGGQDAQLVEVGGGQCGAHCRAM